MSLTTIVEQLLSELERPDLQAKCNMFVPEAIRTAHGIRKFSKDLHKVVVTDPIVSSENSTNISLSQSLPRLRAIRNVELYGSYTEPQPGLYVLTNQIPTQEFKNRAELNDITDYYGIRYQYLYATIGDDLSMKGVDQQTKAIQFYAFLWPELTVDQVTQSYESTSWIVAEYPWVIKAILRNKLAGIIQKRELSNSAQQDYKFAMEALLNESYEEVY